MVHSEEQNSAKRSGQPLGDVNSVAGQNNNNFLLHITDTRRGEKYLVDGGALLSILPPNAQQLKNGPNGEELRAANGSVIPCYGTFCRTLTIGDRNFPFEFVVAAVSQRILGADFLAQYYLAPNHRDAVLLDLRDFSQLPAEHAHGAVSMPVNFVTQIEDPCYKLLDTYPEILKPSFKLAEPEHGVHHYIPTSGRPVQSRARRLDPEKLAVAKAELDKLEALGVCYRGRSEWSSPLLVTTKPCGGWRVCGDYRRLNAMTEDDRYPVRTLTDFTSELHGKKVFSKIDLLKGYHQIPVALEDVPKTAVITPFGLYIFPRTPFGLKNAGQDFQRLMDTILGDLPRVFVYIDDILVASESLEQHLEDLDQVFQILAANGMVVQRPKCILGQTELEFLGYKVNADGITPLQDRVVAIEATKPPRTVKELQRFLGMLGYYRRFIPNAAQHLYYLFDALKGKPKTLEWTPECQASFEATKAALAAATLLHHPRPGAQLALTTDASNTAIGGVLEQRGPQGWEPLGFYSAKLEPNQQQWPPYDRELLAAFKGCRHFRSWIEGRAFTLYTDHQSLVPSIHKKTDPQTLRQTYQLSCVAEYTTDIRYVEGKANMVADALSRPNEEAEDVNAVTSRVTQVENPLNRITSVAGDVPSASEDQIPARNASSTNNAGQNSISTNAAGAHRAASAAKAAAAATDLHCVVAAVGDLGLDWNEIATQQPLDPEYRRLRNEVRTGLNFKSVECGNQQLVVDISNGFPRPYIPYASRRRVFDVFHGLGHPGVERTRQSISEKVVWPSMRQDVSQWARECLQCQQAKVTKNVVPPIGEFKVPNRRFSHVNIDIVTMPESNGNKYLLTAVDRFTRWPIAVPMVDMTAESVINAFTFGWIQTFGVPTTITSDRGTQFTSSTFTQLARIWGIELILTTPYHPEANGLVERFHRRMKEALLALGSETPEAWFWRIPMVMLSIRTTLKPDIKASPADLVFGEGLAVPGELLPSTPATDDQLLRQRRAALADMRIEVARLQPTPTSAHRCPLVHLPDDLQTCSHVFIRRPAYPFTTLATPYLGPYRVIARSNVNFTVAIPGRQNETVNISRVKPALRARSDDEEVEPEAHPPDGPTRRRPRPRGRRRDRDNRSGLGLSPPPPASPPRSPSPPIRRHVPRGRARQLPSDDEDAPPPAPQPAEEYFDHPLDYDCAVDEVPEWNPPDWWDADAVADWSEEPEVDPAVDVAADDTPEPGIEPEMQPQPEPEPPPPPPRPPRPPRRKKRGNPNWVKGGSFAGRHQRDHVRPGEPEAPQSPPRRWRDPSTAEPAVTRQRRKPNVSAILDYLGIVSPSSPSHSASHECSLKCDELNNSTAAGRIRHFSHPGL